MKNTSAPIAPATIGHCSPEFLTTNDVRTYFGIKKGTLYNLSKLGKVRGKTLRATGQFKGVRIWSAESIRSYINSQTDDVWSTVE